MYIKGSFNISNDNTNTNSDFNVNSKDEVFIITIQSFKLSKTPCRYFLIYVTHQYLQV